jgi:hypothetical protein
MLSGIVISIALSTTMVPPGAMVENHGAPGHFTQPTIRRFERRQEDNDRGLAWVAYCKELEQLWNEYREAGSTPRAWREYNAAAAEAKRRYVYADPYLAPVTP